MPNDKKGYMIGRLRELLNKEKDKTAKLREVITQVYGCTTEFGGGIFTFRDNSIKSSCALCYDCVQLMLTALSDENLA